MQNKYPYPVTLHKVTTGQKNTRIKTQVWQRVNADKLSLVINDNVMYESEIKPSDYIRKGNALYVYDIRKALNYFTQQLALAQKIIATHNSKTKLYDKTQRDVIRFTEAVNTLSAMCNAKNTNEA